MDVVDGRRWWREQTPKAGGFGGRGGGTWAQPLLVWGAQVPRVDTQGHVGAGCVGVRFLGPQSLEMGPGHWQGHQGPHQAAASSNSNNKEIRRRL